MSGGTALLRLCVVQNGLDSMKKHCTFCSLKII